VKWAREGGRGLSLVHLLLINHHTIYHYYTYIILRIIIILIILIIISSPAHLAHFIILGPPLCIG